MKSVNPKWPLLILCLLPLFTVGAQGTELRGRIVDAESNTPLPYANIISNETGTSSNQDGKFILHLNDATAETAITIKYIGYQNFHTTAQYVKQNPEIKLIPESEILETVTVYSAENIIDDLINHYQINYEFNDLMLKSYYKESIQLSSNYFYIGEGLFDIYLPTVFSEDKTIVSSIKTRKKEFDGIDTIAVPHVTGHVSDMVNAATRRKSSFLSKEGRQHYEYSKEDLSYYDGREVFKIHFEPKDKLGRSRGTLYVDAESKAIIKADYYPLIENQLFWSHAHWTEEFKEIDGTWYIHRVSYVGEWTNDNQVYRYQADMIITDSEVIKSSPNLDHQLSDTASLFDEATSFSSEFWEEQNHLLLTEEEELALAIRQ